MLKVFNNLKLFIFQLNKD